MDVRASEYIGELERLIAEHGDLKLIDSHEEPIGPPEEVEGDIVVCDRA